MSPVPLPQGWSSPAAPPELSLWAPAQQEEGAGWEHGRAVPIRALGAIGASR